MMEQVLQDRIRELVEENERLRREVSDAYKKGYKAAQDKYFRDSDD